MEENPLDEPIKDDEGHMIKFSLFRVELTGVFAWTYYMLMGLLILRTGLEICIYLGIL